MDINALSDAVNAVAPDLSDELYKSLVTALVEPMKSSGIWNNNRVAAFIGQGAIECARFTHMVENLNYRAETISRVFPTHDAEDCAHNPEALGNRVYANRMGNGDEASGDGYRFRGRGIFGLTGRTNYQTLANALKRPLDDAFLAYLETLEGAAVSACHYWTTNNLSRYADQWDLRGLTHAINGGYNGLADRIALCNAALAGLQS